MTQQEMAGTIAALLSERDELRVIGAWIVREWFESPGVSGDLSQAISAMNALVDAKDIPLLREADERSTE